MVLAAALGVVVECRKGRTKGLKVQGGASPFAFVAVLKGSLLSLRIDFALAPRHSMLRSKHPPLPSPTGEGGEWRQYQLALV